MHIPEGIVSPPVLAGGAIVAAIGVAVGLRRLDDERIPVVAVLTSAFFVASLIHVPVGTTSVHLMLTALMGLILGWAAFPAVLVGLLLQALLFGHGGLTALGVNTVIMAGPAVACHYMFRAVVNRRGRTTTFIAGCVAGGVSVAMSGALFAAVLLTTGSEYAFSAAIAAAAHAPIIMIEALVTGSVLSFISRVRPEILIAAATTVAVDEDSADEQ